MYALINGIIFTNHSILRNHAIMINEGFIEAVIPESGLTGNIHCIDLQGANVSPGFIDLQLNGCGGVMFNSNPSPHTLKTMQNANLLSGTTSFLPTFITDADTGMQQAIQATKHYMDQTSHEVLGLHLEGPYISVEKKGIHRAQFIRQADSQMIEHICDHANYISKVTLAPEQTDNHVIKQLYDAGIVVSIGHTNATYQQAYEAIEHGATFATHLFNAMTSLTGREPGVVGAVYNSHIYAGIIVDGYHVAYENVKLSKKIMDERLILVTDATAAAGANIEAFDFVGTQVYVKDGKCLDKDGCLGGAAVTMIESIQQCVHKVDIPLEEAIRMATLYPAKAISMDHKLGSIEAGKVANLAIFNQQFQVKATVVNGVFKENTLDT